MRSFREIFSTLVVESNEGKIQVRNKKSGNIYWTKKFNPQSHELVTGVGEKRPRSKASEIVSAPLDKDVRSVIRQQLETAAENAGQTVGYRKILGRTYVVGITTSGEKIIYDWNGRNYTYDEFFEIEKERRRELDKLNRIHKIDDYLGSLDRMDPTNIEKLKQRGKVEFKQLTDNHQLRDRITRNYPTVKGADGRYVIVDGRFSGYYLDDMINRIGRHVAGSAFAWDPESGSVRKLHYRTDTGEIRFRVKHEPYVTMNDGNQMTVIIPDDDRTTNARLRRLAKSLKSLNNVSGKTWVFQLSDYELVETALRGHVMSESASNMVQDMYESRKASIQRDVDADYSHISTSAMEGFIPESEGGREFNTAQKYNIGWLSGRGYGAGKVVGAETGVGKTGIMIGLHKMWQADGTLGKDGKNGKTLVVTKKALRGNVAGELANWLKDPRNESRSIVSISYQEFMRHTERYKDYGAIMFDEAHALKGQTAKVVKAALSFEHPRKVCLTGSIIQKSPEDLFNLIEISRGKKIGSVELNSKRKQFRQAYCEVVGNKVIGMKEDERVMNQFYKYVKANAVHTSKTEVAEFPLPSATPPHEQTTSLMMEGAVKDEYNKLAEPIRDTLRRMADKYKNGELKQSEISQEMSMAMVQLNKLRDFSNHPEEYVKGITNPKIDALEEYIEQTFHRNDSSKTVTFADNPKLAEKAAKRLSEKFTHRKHVLALADEIRVYRGGEVVETFKENGKYVDDYGNEIPVEEWQGHVFSLLKKDEDIATWGLTKAYTEGHNLQHCNNVVHLDRDSWNARNMEQREARVWRTGQRGHVDIKILDLALDDGSSYNEIEKYSQHIEDQLFHRIVRGSRETKLDFSDPTVDVDSLIRDKDMLRFQLSPAQMNRVAGVRSSTPVPAPDQLDYVRQPLVMADDRGNVNKSLYERFREIFKKDEKI